MTHQDWSRHRLGWVRLHVASPGWTRQGSPYLGMVTRGKAGLGVAYQGTAPLLFMAWLGSVGRNLARHAAARLGKAWLP